MTSGFLVLKLCCKIFESQGFPGEMFSSRNVFPVRSKLVSFSELRVRRVGGQQKETAGGLSANTRNVFLVAQKCICILSKIVL